jgi:hypothetical protein
MLGSPLGCQTTLKAGLVSRQRKITQIARIVKVYLYFDTSPSGNRFENSIIAELQAFFKANLPLRAQHLTFTQFHKSFSDCRTIVSQKAWGLFILS